MSPLQDITVVDFTELLPGPFLTQSLAEFGAKVIKIERPPHGDSARRMAPGVFNAVNRGKLSLQADLKSAPGREQVLGLIETADVVVESYRPGVMERLGLDYEKVRALNPGVVYASVTGYGQQARRALLPGHDINYQAASGALALSGLPDGRPQHVFGLQVADLCGALYGLSSVMTALFQRERTGVGQYLDIAITDCLTHWINPRLGAFYAHGIDGLPAQRRDALNKPAYGVFRTFDDRDITIGALENHFWQGLTRVLDLAPFDTEDFHAYDARAERAGEIKELLTKRVAAWNCAELERALLAADVPVMVVHSPTGVMEGTAVVERGLRIEGADGPLIRFPVRLSGMDAVQLSVLPNAYRGEPRAAEGRRGAEAVQQ